MRDSTYNQQHTRRLSRVLCDKSEGECVRASVLWAAGERGQSWQGQLWREGKGSESGATHYHMLLPRHSWQAPTVSQPPRGPRRGCSPTLACELGDSTHPRLELGSRSRVTPSYINQRRLSGTGCSTRGRRARGQANASWRTPRRDDSPNSTHT